MRLYSTNIRKVRRQISLNGICQFCTRLEFNHFFSSNFNLLFRCRINTHPCRTLVYRKCTESQKSDFVSRLQSFGYCIKCNIKSLFGIRF